MLAVSVAFLWLAVLLSWPRRPVGVDETAWRVYARLQGTRERLVLIALIGTMALFLVAVIGMASHYGGRTIYDPCTTSREIHLHDC